MKKKLVWVSPFIPYENVDHASGKIQNFYLNRLIAADQYDVRLIGFYWPSELDKFTLNQKIRCDLFCYHSHGWKKYIRNLMDLNYLKNPFNRYANMTTKFLEYHILKTLREYYKENYHPDIIILDWTQTILFINKVKEIFPHSKIVGIEEDVSLLSYQRRIALAKGRVGKYLASVRYRNIQREEIRAVNQCNMVILNNEKDYALLKRYEITARVEVWSVYFENRYMLRREDACRHDVMFFGSMSRPENYLSAQWLLEKVKPRLADTDVRFVIVGGNPPAMLKAYQDTQTIVTGFVEDVTPYFMASLCLAAPLVLGAGIKVKILEALASGLPVLTNEIGIEGIPAENGRDYFFCERPEDYADRIRELLEQKHDVARMAENAKKLIREHFDYEKSCRDFFGWLKEMD